MASVLKYGGDVNKTNEEGSILHVAIKSTSTNLITYIINTHQNFDYRLKDKSGQNILFACVEHSDAHTFNLLINKLLENSSTQQLSYAELLNEKNKKGNGLLHELTLKKDQPLIVVLESKAQMLGVDLDIKDKSGLTYTQLKVI